MIIKSFGRKPKFVKSTSAHIRHQIRYCAKQKELGEENELRPLLTNCAGAGSEELINEFENLAQLRPDLKNPTRHIVLSPEGGDRILTKEEWQQAVDIYREKRGLGDSPYVAYLHEDGHGERHPHHLHVFFCVSGRTAKRFPTALIQMSIATPLGR